MKLDGLINMCLIETYSKVCRGCQGEHLDLRGRKWEEAGEDCIMRSFVTL
jgi:hypothetical protein